MMHSLTNASVSLPKSQVQIFFDGFKGLDLARVGKGVRKGKKRRPWVDKTKGGDQTTAIHEGGGDISDALRKGKGDHLGKTPGSGKGSGGKEQSFGKREEPDWLQKKHSGKKGEKQREWVSGASFGTRKASAKAGWGKANGKADGGKKSEKGGGGLILTKGIKGKGRSIKKGPGQVGEKAKGDSVQKGTASSRSPGEKAKCDQPFGVRVEIPALMRVEGQQSKKDQQYQDTVKEIFWLIAASLRYIKFFAV